MRRPVFWVVKGTRRRNDFDVALRPGVEETWVTKAPPVRLWAPGDRIFLWRSSPDRELIGLGELGAIGKIDPAGTRFTIRYLTAPLPRPLGLADLRERRALADAAFLKPGPARMLVRLTDEQATALETILRRANPVTAVVFERWATERMRAISIRQPYVELILRGEKRFEYRSRPTRVLGRVYLYAGCRPGAAAAWRKVGLEPGYLPTGAILGTAVVMGCRYFEKRGEYGYELANPVRLQQPRVPDAHPMPCWFYPFST